MSEMRKSLLVEIFVPTLDDRGGDGGGSVGAIGTGYPVAHDVILTARHVIDQPDRDDNYPIAVRWYDYPDAGPSAGWFDLKREDVIWRKDEVDAVLLRCPRPPAVERYPGMLSAEAPPQGDGWHSAGFPAAAKRADRRAPANFAGKMHSMSPSWQYFEVDVDASPDNEKGWKGASGMPVFSRGKIFGVAKEVPLHFSSKKLHVVPAFRLLEDEDFAKKIGYAAQKDVRRIFEEKLTALFRGSPEAIEFLRRPGHLLAGVHLPPRDMARRVACALLDRPMEEVINGLAVAHEKMFDGMRLEQTESLTGPPKLSSMLFF
jgi:hypothetical protein